MKIRFEWDALKAKGNVKKHRVSFEVATLVFADPFAWIAQDRIENGEYRRRPWGLLMAACCLWWRIPSGTTRTALR